ncbi:MAG: CapA family protein [Eubacteriales bacterium]|nr:CapA family protein [Eubacteriales bacterium]
MKRALAVLTALLLPFSGAVAETRVTTFAYTDPPAELTATAMAVVQGDTEITLTFGGDCTLGGEGAGGRRFERAVEAGGYAYPFAGLQTLLHTDDLTLVNLEGVLSDRTDGKADKQFTFAGKPAYAGILSLGSVECVTLNNNHVLDYGAAGKRDTLAALDAQGVAYCDDTYVTVLDKDGVRVGFTSSGLRFDEETFLAQAAALNNVGCVAIIHSMHMGEEYADTLTNAQQAAARFAAEHGAVLVVGHHPHVVQGMAIYDHTPVVFSLGNCVFGGNTDPKDYDACLLSATLRFTDGALKEERLTLWPISVSGSAGRNDYQPRFLAGEDAQRVIRKMQATSTIALAPYLEGTGAVQPEFDWR